MEILFVFTHFFIGKLFRLFLFWAPKAHFWNTCICNLFLCNQSCKILISRFSIEATVFQPCAKLVFQKCGRRKKFLVWGCLFVLFFNNKFPYRDNLSFFLLLFFPAGFVFALSWGRCLVFKYILVVNFSNRNLTPKCVCHYVKWY